MLPYHHDQRPPQQSSYSWRSCAPQGCSGTSRLFPNFVRRISRTSLGSRSSNAALRWSARAVIGSGVPRLTVTDDHMFLSAGDRRIAASMVNYTFRRVVRLAGIAAERTRPCRIHDLRHTFATRSLQQCSIHRKSVSRHCVALATYLGRTDIVHTYWYLEATPRSPP